MALVVEDGTGVAGADSWTDLVWAASYALAHGHDAAWTAATTDEQEIAMRRGAQYILVVYGDRLPWSLGVESTDPPPSLLQAAQVEAAVRELVPGTLLPDQTGSGARLKKRVQVGPMSIEYVDAVAVRAADRIPIIEGLLAGLLTHSGGMKWLLRA